MVIGRPTEFDQDEVVDAAMALFWQHGYEATSLTHLLDAMSLSRSSFYHSFHSKHALFLCCLERYRARTVADLETRLQRAPSGKAFLEEALYWAIEEAMEATPPRGCLIMNTATEFAQRDEGIAATVSGALDEYRSIFRRAVERGQSEGSVSQDLDGADLAGYLVSAMSGLRTMVKAGTDAVTLKRMVRVVTDTF